MDLTSIEVYHWVKENKSFFEHAKFEKAWQVGDYIIIRFYIKGQGNKDLVIGNGSMFFTSYDIIKPPQPTNFAMVLRKHLKGKWVKGFKQYNLDRIIVWEFENCYLIVELMRLTNVILVDKNMRILGLLKPVKSKTRDLSLRKEYVFPESKKSILEESFEEFKKNIRDDFFSIPNIYGIHKKYVSYAIDKCGNNYECMFNMLRRFYEETSFCMCEEEVLGYCIRDECKRVETINEAIEKVAIKEVERETFEMSLTEKSKPSKEEKKIDYMVKGLEEMKKKLEVTEKQAGWLNENIDKVEDALESVKRNNEHELVEKVDYNKGVFFISTPYGRAKLNISKNVYVSMQALYDEIKELKKKISNLEKRITEEKEKANKESKIKESAAFQLVKKKKERKWYERFKWFFTSKGNLFVLGKDATTNEILIKKYMQDNDLVFHMLLPGSGFGLLKNVRGNEDQDEIFECAQFTACHSSLWKQKVFHGEVFWVYPEQVSKKPPSGEFIAKGSFMIYGKKNILKVPLELSFGYDREKREVIYGSLSMVLKITRDYAIIIPGDKKAKDLIPKIKSRICRNLSKDDCLIVERWDDEFFRERIPFGMGDVRGKA